jgi:hypothetical protein
LIAALAVGATPWQAKTVWYQEASSAVVLGHVIWFECPIPKNAEPPVAWARSCEEHGSWLNENVPRDVMAASEGSSTSAVQFAVGNSGLFGHGRRDEY